MTALDELPDLVAPSPRLDGEAWLAAARTGGLPAPGLSRWQPLRVGVVNLWEYDRAEFWWADGRLVLRGGNGAGKTKVLELTTLMLLRGEIHPRVLDPFGSKHRTMRYNLLPTGEDDDPRPVVDSAVGYAWAEFGRLDADGAAHYLVCGLGASARRGSGSDSTNRWMFLTDLRPGQGLHLASAAAPVEEKELRKVVGVDVFTDAGRYRGELASRLFGLADVHAYDNLTELLKQLRKPKLGERLDLTGLARMLRDALPPLETDEVTRLVDGWERLARLRGVLEATEHAATEVAGFVRSGWRPWARTVVRLRADALAGATSRLDQTTRDRRSAEKTLADAETEVGRSGAALATARRTLSDRETELTALLDSQAYKDAVSATRNARWLATQAETRLDLLNAANTALDGAQQELDTASEAYEQALAACDTADAEVVEAAEVVRRGAAGAGLGPSAEQHLPARDVPSLLADHGRRSERLRHLVQLRAAWTKADGEVETAASAVAERQRMAQESAAAATQAETAVLAAVEQVQDALREWAEAAVVGRPTPEQLATWYDLLADLTDPAAFDPAVSQPAVSQPAGRVGRPLTDAVRTHVEALRTGLDERRRQVALRRAPVAAQRDKKAAELAAAQDATEHPPPVPLGWRRRARPGPEAGEGAPFWRCVEPTEPTEPAEPVPDPDPGLDLDVLEAALAASGLLDAWLTPDGTMRTADGGALLADTSVQPQSRQQSRQSPQSFGQPRPGGGPSLASVLAPTADGGVDPAAIAAVLHSIGWYPSRPDTAGAAAFPAGWIAADGSWRVGALTGHAEPAQAASYLGATAREQARARTVARLRAEITELDAQLSGLREADDELISMLAALADEHRRAPDEQPVLQAMGSYLQLRAQAHKAEREYAQLSRHLARLEAARDEARAQFAGFAAEHAFPLDGLDDLGRALAEFRGAARQLEGALRLLGIQQTARDGAQAHRSRAGRRHADALAAREAAAGQERTARVRAAEAQAALGRDHATQLSRRQTLESDIARTKRAVDDTNGRLTDLKIQAADAKNVLDRHEAARAQASQARDDALAAWWEGVDAGLTRYFGIADPDRRVVETALDGARAARRELTTATVPGRADEERAWRRCLERLQDLRQTLLPNRDARTTEPHATEPHATETHATEPHATETHVTEPTAGGLEAGGLGAAGLGAGGESGAATASVYERTIVLVEVLVDEASGWLPPPEASDTLHAKVVAERERFDAEQEQVLARLLGSTFIEHLKDRLDSSHATFARINSFLAACPTRQGHTLRLEWNADPRDAEASRVIGALQQGYAELTPDRQEMVRAFLARRIEEAREAAAGRGVADWRDDLESALDYRGWLRVELLYRAGSQGRWRPFDAGRHGSKSGGEKVVLLSQPLFAAAVVAYDAAGPLAPRMVWLDEAMTGVDDGVKAAFMGLLVQFDLDVMLTAHDEWCRYPTVPAAAVYDLARQRHVAGVDALPFLWCAGSFEEVTMAPAGQDAMAQRIASDDGLFADLGTDGGDGDGDGRGYGGGGDGDDGGGGGGDADGGAPAAGQ